MWISREAEIRISDSVQVLCVGRSRKMANPSSCFTSGMHHSKPPNIIGSVSQKSSARNSCRLYHTVCPPMVANLRIMSFPVRSSYRFSPGKCQTSNLQYISHPLSNCCFSTVRSLSKVPITSQKAANFWTSSRCVYLELYRTGVFGNHFRQRLVLDSSYSQVTSRAFKRAGLALRHRKRTSYPGSACKVKKQLDRLEVSARDSSKSSRAFCKILRLVPTSLAWGSSSSFENAGSTCSNKLASSSMWAANEGDIPSSSPTRDWSSHRRNKKQYISGFSSSDEVFINLSGNAKAASTGASPSDQFQTSITPWRPSRQKKAFGQGVGTLSGIASSAFTTNVGSLSLFASSYPRCSTAVLAVARGNTEITQTGSNLLSKLHQQLEDQGGTSSTAAVSKPLDEEEAANLRERLKEQRRKGMQAICNRMKGRVLSDNEDEEEFSYAVDPDTLTPGEYVVHKRVGVGCFIGTKYEIPDGKDKAAKYIYLKYADGVAKLRAKQAHRLLYRYHSPGETGRAPALSKLNDTTLWDKRKDKGKVAIQKLVVNMMELYIHRLKQTRPPYPKCGSSLASFVVKFPYTATPDQEQAFLDVERDMTERETPMDRLICGDVGFGKTEVALRAIFCATAAGKQVMVLAPTTVLAKQHYEVVRERFAAYSNIKVALLSRFQKESEKKEVVAGIHEGSLSIVIGTHALLGSQIRYQNLGLLVVDEEQRFGVRQKERITSLKTTVDVLTLSATPIPRTLYLALSGFRDASLITTPPPERRPITTHLLEFQPQIVKSALSFELNRGGQVFYVVPRVKGIEVTKAILESYFPTVGIAVAHGQQSAYTLEDAMEQFAEGKTLILLCTSIVESGLDIRRVNTIIIEDVQLFGLAQLYQLRGRVGRADREAHAYMFHPSKDQLSDDALERLVALEDCCGLGQGFQLAERDMAIRGIGSIFGEKQSGDVAKIGVDLYLEMLFEGLSKVDHQKLPQVEYDEVQLELAVDIHIPGEYISTASQREKVMNSAEEAARDSMHALMLFTNRMRNEYGQEPPSIEMLLKTMYVKRIAADLGIHRIRTRGKTVVMETTMESEAFEMLCCAVTSSSVQASLVYESGRIEMKGLIGLPVERQMERIFGCLAEMRNGLPSFVKYI